VFEALRESVITCVAVNEILHPFHKTVAFARDPSHGFVANILARNISRDYRCHSVSDFSRIVPDDNTVVIVKKIVAPTNASRADDWQTGDEILNASAHLPLHRRKTKADTCRV
jgi:hypothetical protein